MSATLRRRISVAAVVPLAIAGLSVVASNEPAAATGRATFTNFEPAGLKSFLLDEGGGVVGTKCPGAGPKVCYNIAAEPAIRADEKGNFYAASENGLGAGTEAWKSTDGGRHYVTLPSPNALSNGSGFAPGGGDVDVAVGDDTNKAGYVPLYISSLSLANIDVSSSQDGGKNFFLQPFSATLPGDDREWVAADDSRQLLGLPIEGGDKVCISYHDPEQNISVNCSYDGGKTFPQYGSAIDVSHAAYLVADNAIGNLAIARDTFEGDGTRGNHNIYQIFSGPVDVSGLTACGGPPAPCYNAVWMGVSTDGGVSFTDYPVHIAGNVHVSYGHQFTNVSVDRKGNVYAVYSDNHNLYYSFSTTQGTSWKGPYRVNGAPANTAIFPWSVAGNNGALDIVYYGTSYANAGVVPDNYPKTAAWHVYFAQNLHATTAGSSFSQVAASPVNHYGGVCESGVACSGNRDLYDDFGVAASPTTGLASIVYSDDQFRANDANNPNAPSCKVATTNTSSCDHTAFATQLSGPGVY